MQKIDAENTTFSTIESFKRQGSAFAKYKLSVIDECSTVSNKDMVEILQKANFEMLLLVGNTYQIDAIQFGNWFSVLKAFLPESAVFEFIQLFFCIIFVTIFSIFIYKSKSFQSFQFADHNIDKNMYQM